MILPPVEVLLSWPTPNYENPTTRGDALLIVNSIFLSLAVITVSLRMYTRLMIKRWLGIDDVFILLGLVKHHFSTRTPPQVKCLSNSCMFAGFHNRLGSSRATCEPTLRLG